MHAKLDVVAVARTDDQVVRVIEIVDFTDLTWLAACDRSPAVAERRGKTEISA